MTKETQRDRVDGMLVRDVEFTRADINEENRTIELSFSSEKPVTRESWFDDPWVEILGHDENEADLTRLNTGAPLLYDHSRSNRDDHLGVVERAWLENGRGKALVRFSNRESVSEMWEDVRNGILPNVSVGYQIHERTLLKKNEKGPDEYRVTKWLPMEVSIVTVPADATVGVNRSDNYPIVQLEDRNMVEKTETPEVTETPQPVINAEAVRAEGRAEERAANKARRTEIRSAFVGEFATKHADILNACLDDDDVTVDQARAKLLEAVGAGQEPAATESPATIVRDASDKFKEGATIALRRRAGLLTAEESKNDSELNDDMRGRSLLDMARYSLDLSGQSDGGDKLTVVGRAFTSTSDFPSLLADVANKAMMKGYSEQPETYREWCSIGNLSDFKTANRIGLSEYGALPTLAEGAEYTYAGLSEYQEQIVLATYGSMFSITRQAIINDDLSGFTRVPAKMGQAARRTVGDIAYAILTVNANMRDGNAMFSVAHANYETGAGSALDAASVDLARVNMATQSDESGSATALNIRPSTLLVPAALEGAARRTMEAEHDPDTAGSLAPNTVRGLASVVSDARLDADSATRWYMAGDPSVYDTVEVAFLDGNDSPFMDQQSGWNIDGVDYKVRIDVGAASLDWRAIHMSDGA